MIEPLFLSVDELAERWGVTRRQILEHGMMMRFPTWYMFDGTIVQHPDLDRPSMDHYGPVRALTETISRLMIQEEIPHPTFALGSKPEVYLKLLTGQGLAPEDIIQLAPGRLNNWKGTLSITELLIPMQSIKYLERAKDVEQPRSVKPRPRTATQEAMVLEAIRELGHDPGALPSRQPGRPGVKKLVFAKLSDQTDLFTSSTLSKTWDRLRANGKIVGGL
ncbi:hypothetical protein [Pseudomonas putida]|uniref:hypothetical protein n=1 Tax=Pseudomonas putida TaxID=303 RepID=UPI000B3C8D3D|nr:hypothetical protein [Pseudomonas putida]OUS81032.1 hypothetical protein CBP05_18075 [Pseudomonas putida]OUS86069.1 hypothetical protein CBP06_19150 [Pseudomonas putida]